VVAAHFYKCLSVGAVAEDERLHPGKIKKTRADTFNRNKYRLCPDVGKWVLEHRRHHDQQESCSQREHRHNPDLKVASFGGIRLQEYSNN
jgi:hypothetical protein